MDNKQLLERAARAAIFKFSMKAAPRDPTGYYHVRWDQAELISVFAENRGEAMSKASSALGKNNRNWPWTFIFTSIDEVDSSATKAAAQSQENT